MKALRRVSYAVVFHLFVGTIISAAQAQTVDVGGRAFLDYFYIVSSPIEADEGYHGFTYRRLYLTTDFSLSDDFRGRARLEANDGTTGPKGPVPFIKDLFLTWVYSGDHSATLGITPPPAFRVAESVWRYRSLEKTIHDFQGIVSSRDFGIRFDGPISPGGMLRYAAMLSNNSGTQTETDRYKRVYAELAAYPTTRLSFSVGADHAGYDGPIESSTRVSGFAGYTTDVIRLGLEGYWFNVDHDTAIETENIGVSLFGSVNLAPEWEMVGRVDRTRDELPGADRYETFILAGVSYSPNEFVRLIPNVWLFKIDDMPRDEMLGRFTVDVRF